MGTVPTRFNLNYTIITVFRFPLVGETICFLIFFLFSTVGSSDKFIDCYYFLLSDLYETGVVMAVVDVDLVMNNSFITK